MFNIFTKNNLSPLVLLLLTTINVPLVAWDYDSAYGQGYDCCDQASHNRFYIGAFGGELFSNSSRISQMGTAFFTEAQGGPLAVYAHGNSKKISAGFGGGQIGYEFSEGFNCGCSDWTLAPAGEIEAYYYSHKKQGHLINTTDRLPEHDFHDSFHLNTTVVLVNAVLSLNNRCWKGFTPYIGGGIGATHLSLRNATSTQVDPPEVGVNHFNAERNDSSWAFAAQAKAGIRYTICDSFHIFAEYRYLFVDSSNYVLGSTVYPTHAPTSPWNIKVKDLSYNAFAVGIQYDL